MHTGQPVVAPQPIRKTEIVGHMEQNCAGSAAIVGAGVVPFALGNDAGGSIRVPASYCGAVGLFPTHSRVPSQSGTKHYKTTTMSDGPIAGTAVDAAMVYACIAARCSDSQGVCVCCMSPLFMLTYSTSYSMEEEHSLLCCVHGACRKCNCRHIQSVCSRLSNFTMFSLNEHHSV
jgi:hypothetical protein